MSFVERLNCPKARDIFKKKGIYYVYLTTPYVNLPYEEHFYLIETGESCSYVREYLTKKKIPIRYGKHYIYIDFYNRRDDIHECNSNLTGAYQFPYYIKYDKVIIDKEYDIDSYKDFGIWIPTEIAVDRKYDYDFPHSQASAKVIAEYCEKHKDIEAFSSHLETIFSSSIDNYLKKEWPHQYIYGPDIYWNQREAAKQKMMKKL